jgi:hypothetical protein
VIVFQKNWKSPEGERFLSCRSGIRSPGSGRFTVGQSRGCNQGFLGVGVGLASDGLGGEPEGVDGFLTVFFPWCPGVGSLLGEAVPDGEGSGEGAG